MRFTFNVIHVIELVLLVSVWDVAGSCCVVGVLLFSTLLQKFTRCSPEFAGISPEYRI